MLVGRERECEVVDRLLSRARAGEGSALLVRGEAGIGKSALLEYGSSRAAGFDVVRARGVEAEAELPFAGLAAFARPLLGHVEELPEPQREALAGALALASPSGTQRFAVGVALVGLLSAAAAERPVLVLADDVHWLDPASREALLFAARRVEHDAVGVMLASRDEEPHSLAAVGVAEVRLEPLSPEDARTLLAGRHELARGVSEELVRLAAGNPLALLELPTLLTSAERSGADPLREPLAVGSGVEGAFLARARRLPEDTQRALLVVCADPGADVSPIERALARLGLDRSALEPAEHAHLVSIPDGRVELHHPLVRSAIYGAASSAERREAHRALASALRGDRRAWHLAAAADGPAEDAAAALEAAGERAAERTGYATATRAFERAAELSADDEGAARRLLRGARMAEQAGMYARAHSLLDAADARATDVLLRADIAHLRAMVLSLQGQTVSAARRLESEAEVVLSVDASRASRMLRDATFAAASGDEWELAERLATRACEAADVASDPDPLAPLAADYVAYRRAQSRTPSAQWSRIEELSRDFELLPLIATIADEELGATVTERLIDEARRRSALGVLPDALLMRGERRYYHFGEWPAAYADFAESAELAAEVGQPLVRYAALMHMARVEAFQGREDECRAHVEESRILALESAAPKSASYLGVILGELELTLGRPEAAVDELERALPDLEPAISRARCDLIEALVLAGRPDQARSALAILERQVEIAGQPRGYAYLGRLRGLLAGEDFEQHFEAAFAHDPFPLERTRTHLLLGERLRRAGRRADAREHLRAAMLGFERLGAGPWADRARSELEATGETVRRGESALTDELTPQELRVALTVADGATNKEAAGKLFVSPNTIEFHLKNVFRKLGVRSRTELARRVAP